MEGNAKIVYWICFTFCLLRPVEFLLAADAGLDNEQQVPLISLSNGLLHRPLERSEANNSYNKEFRWPRSVEKSRTKERLVRPSVPRHRFSSDFHRALYGTQEGVKHLIQNYGPRGLGEAKRDYEVSQELEEVREANKHFLFVRKTARCREPRAKVIRVNDFYPDPEKEYLPRSTVLHRCDKESGCCEEGFQCVPRFLQEVTLHFYVTYKQRHKVIMNLSNSVEKLLFANHTECECQLIAEKPTESPSEAKNSSEDENDVSKEDASAKHVHQNSRHFIKCSQCPKPFSRREFSDGRCGCDCFDKQRSCIRVKRGRQPLPEAERRCVAAGECHVPECDTGDYDVISGRCPKKPDDYRRRPIHRGEDFASNRHWFERD